MSNRNIALIGGRAAGKTVIARELAERLDRSLFVLDELIAARAGKSIPRIVEEIGWSGFRDLEYEVASRVGAMKNAIIDCGGGVICDQDKNNVQSYSECKVKALKKNSIVVWLDCPVEEQLRRMGKDPNRPSISGTKSAREEMQDIMELRRPWYRKTADFVIDTTKKSVEEVVEEIVCFFCKRG